MEINYLQPGYRLFGISAIVLSEMNELEQRQMNTEAINRKIIQTNHESIDHGKRRTHVNETKDKDVFKFGYHGNSQVRKCMFIKENQNECDLFITNKNANIIISGIVSVCKLLLALCLVTTMLFGMTVASTKKGVGVGFNAGYHCTDEYKLNNVHWWYTWKQRPDNMHHRHNCSYDVRSGFTPMIHGHHFNRGINISSKPQYLLGFNEPDHKGSANLTVDQAVPMWKEVEKHAAGKVLVSPAVTNLNWLTEFFQKCHNCRVDHVAVHIYSCDTHRVMTKLKETWDRFHRPIWLTEFSCPHTQSVDAQMRFMKAILPLLESAHYVFRYAWFVTRHLHSAWVSEAVSLFKPNSAELTPLGHYYNNFI